MNPDTRDLPTEVIVDLKSQGYSYREILDKFRETHPNTTLTENILANRVKRYRKTHPKEGQRFRRGYETRTCKVCGVKYILGPLDPDVDCCPFHAYKQFGDVLEYNPDGLKENPDSGEWERVSDPYGDQRTQKTWKKGDVIVRIKYLPHSRKYEVRKDDVSKDKLLVNESADSFKSAMIIAERMRGPDLDSLERNPKSSFEPKVKVFNEKKTGRDKLEESEVKEAIGDVAEKETEKSVSSKKEDEENPLCPECKVELEKVKRVEYGRGFRFFFKSNLSSDAEPYFCPECKQLYVLKESESSDLEEGEDCPYCDEALSKIKGSGLLYCHDCHRIFKEG